MPATQEPVLYSDARSFFEMRAMAFLTEKNLHPAIQPNAQTILKIAAALEPYADEIADYGDWKKSQEIIAIVAHETDNDPSQINMEMHSIHTVYHASQAHATLQAMKDVATGEDVELAAAYEALATKAATHLDAISAGKLFPRFEENAPLSAKRLDEICEALATKINAARLDLHCKSLRPAFGDMTTKAAVAVASPAFTKGNFMPEPA